MTGNSVNGLDRERAGRSPNLEGRGDGVEVGVAVAEEMEKRRWTLLTQGQVLGSQEPGDKETAVDGGPLRPQT